MRINLFLGALLFPLIGFAQVGINTPAPSATLDVIAKNATGTSGNVDGLLIPRVDRQRAQSMTGVATSTLIYVNDIATGTATGTAVNIDATGYYYFDGTAWVKLNPFNSPNSFINLYNSNGTLTGNRTVTQGANTLAFTGSAVNAFSVDGNTFSVDAANNRVGIANAAPATELHVGNGTNGPATPTIRLTSNLNDYAGGGVIQFLENNQGYGTIVRHHTANNAGGTQKEGLYFNKFNNNNESTTPILMIEQEGERVGIKTADPTSPLDVNGTARVRSLPQATGATTVFPVYADAEGNLVRASTSGAFQGLNSNTVTVGAGATGTLISGLVGGVTYKVVVTNGNACAYSTVAEFYMTNSAANGNLSIKGIDGLYTGGTGASKNPTFNEGSRNATGVSWSAVGCSDGGDGTSLNYTLTIPSAGTINVTNNGNVARAYTITVIRLT